MEIYCLHGNEKDKILLELNEVPAFSDRTTDTLTNNRDKVNHKTVNAYMDYLCNFFAFYRVRRYDIKGKPGFERQVLFERPCFSIREIGHEKSGLWEGEYTGVAEPRFRRVVSHPLL